MTLRRIDYDCDGVALSGWLADGSGGAPAPGVLVAHEAPGIDDFVQRRAAMLAERGYVALVPDMYGEAFSLEHMMARHATLMTTPGLLLRRATAGLNALTAQPNVDGAWLAAIGFCQGGTVATELARAGTPIVAAIGFHPGLTRPAGSPDAPITAKLLMLVGDLDPVIPPADRVAFAAEMTAKAADWQLHVFGGVGHSFTNPAVDALGMPGFGYDATADRRSWAMALALLEEAFAK